MSLPIPDFLSHLPIDTRRGYPIPFFVPIINGEPNWNYQDADHYKQCLEKNLCAICGKKNNKREWWTISGPLGLKNRVSSEAPCHERCARYALAVCPYMISDRVERKSDDALALPGVHIIEHPKEYYLVKIDKIKTFVEQKHTLYKFRVLKQEKYIYINHKLTPA